MTYQVLARKWRPRSFDQLVGQSHVVKALTGALADKRLHHAYLFTGTRGVGKTTLARILAKAVNCETGITATPCGRCRACTEIDAGRFVDLLEVDAATNTKVDEMRELLDTAQYMPVSGRFKVYIIDEVHMLSRHAFNSMLKTLEEPPEHVKFILATTDPQRLPVTVLSRCLQFNLKALSPLALAAHLKAVLTAEAIAFEDPALAALARAAGGSVRDSLSLTDQAIAFGQGKVLASQVAEMLGAAGGDRVWPLLERIAQADGPGALAEVDQMVAGGLSCDQALQDMASILHRVALVHHGVGPEADDPDAPRIDALAGQVDAARVQVLYQVAVLGRRDLALAPDEPAGLAMTVMRMLSFSGPGGAALASASEAATSPRASASLAPPRQAAASSSSGATRDGIPVASEASDANRAVDPVPATVMSTFDGDWPALVERQGLSGMAGLLARHAELGGVEGSHVMLQVAEAHKAYADKAYVDKLKVALVPAFGPGVRVSVKVGGTSGTSIAAKQGDEARRKHDTAVAAIEQDPFVRDLMGMGAEIVPQSIRPADAAQDE